MRAPRRLRSVGKIAALTLGIVAAATLGARVAAASSPASPGSTAAPKASPRATPEPTATPVPTPAERARAAFDSIVEGRFDRSQLTEALGAELTAARLDGLSRVLRPLGAPTSFALADTRHGDGTTTYDFVVRFADGPVSFTYGIDDATQKVSRLYVRTARS